MSVPAHSRLMRTRAAGPARRRLVFASTLIAIVGTLVGGATAPLVSGFAGANGLIVWERSDANGSEIWTMHQDGTGRTQLTSTGYNSNPKWSPDGSRIVFASNRDGNAEIYVMDADGSDQTRLTNSSNTDTFPTFSPDGSKIAFDSYDNSANNYDIMVMKADGSGAKNITNNAAEDLDPNWKPDGTRIAFRTNRDGYDAIYTMNPDGSSLVNLSIGSPGDGDPSWSPDGAEIAFLRSVPGGGIFIMDADGSSPILVSAQSDQMPSWSPEGDRIVFSSHRDFNDELYSMNADGSGQVRLTHDSPNATYPEDWYPDWQPAPFRITSGPIGFGDSKVGAAGASRTLTVNVGPTDLTVSSVAIGGSDPADFAILSETCTSTPVPALGSCSVSIGFQPTALGPRASTIVFTGPDPLGMQSVVLSGTGAPFGWAAVLNAGPAYTWNDGQDLTRTTKASATYLHAIYTTDRIGSQWASDSGPRVGAYYIRSSNGGASWTKPVRLNPSTQHGSRVSIAASGANVYTTWVSTTKWVHFSGAAPRVLYFRRNTNNGASTSWGPRIRLTPTTGRVDYPIVTASGAYVYVAYTDGKTGAIRVAISSDRGATWKTVTVGSTARATTSGRLGLPTIAASGKYVGVAWLATGSNVVKARVSSSHGGTWGTTATIGKTSAVLSAAAAGSRIGFAWVQGRVAVRTWTAGKWSASHVLPPTDGYASETQVTPTIALLGTKALAVAYGSCLADCSFKNASVVGRTDLIWRASSTNGASWQSSSVIGQASDSSTRRANDAPSLVWPASTHPTVLWNGWTEGTVDYRLYLRNGG